MLALIEDSPFLIARILLFFVATYFIYIALQSIELSKIFKKNSADNIRFLFMVISMILGHLFVDAIISLFENLNRLL
ncbi:MAG: DUF1146 family protein [Candidatus Izemoplasmatales bacterium]|uniref:DUF1146 domain-containing protein n=1 Tax=Hujiaoplasma nucleasis TaxID=2725268 RepID=A0A7L6N6C1_9MOLU|nr:DUF1146 family protein [Hujiaoplasma nucleasis]QLY40109.1 DUF1146 domain-containing protein [Hujiaoplasma nucleasis]